MSEYPRELETAVSLQEVIEAAVGKNDPYPTPAQLAAHQAKQKIQEKLFGNREIGEL